jgi:hypothetical protein
VTLEELEQFVLGEIESYRYEVSEGALGRALPAEKVERLLAEMRAALVKPEWQVVTIRHAPDGPQLAAPVERRCALVARGDAHDLCYDPSEGEFFLTDGNGDIGVWGDAVGCFMAQ